MGTRSTDPLKLEIKLLCMLLPLGSSAAGTFL